MDKSQGGTASGRLPIAKHFRCLVETFEPYYQTYMDGITSKFLP